MPQLQRVRVECSFELAAYGELNTESQSGLTQRLHELVREVVRTFAKRECAALSPVDLTTEHLDA